MGARTPGRRARRDDERGLVLSSPVALLSAGAVVLAAIAFVSTSHGGGDDTEAAARTVGSGTHAGAGPADGAGGSTGSGAAGAGSSGGGGGSDAAAGQGGATDKAGRGDHQSDHAKHQRARQPQVERAGTYVEVYNNSGITGLAASTAAQASSAGWQVVASDNWYGTIPASTVYYPPRLEAAAKLLANDLGISRLHPAIAPMRFDRLTVILTADHA